jgi:prevent-host-death family protein
MERAELGEEILVTRRGRPIVRLVGLDRYAEPASTSSAGTSPHKVSSR